MKREAKLARLEEWCGEWEDGGKVSAFARTDDCWETRIPLIESKLKLLEELAEDVQAENCEARRNAAKNGKKPVSEYKVIQNVVPLQNCKRKWMGVNNAITSGGTPNKAAGNMKTKNKLTNSEMGCRSATARLYSSLVWWTTCLFQKKLTS